MPIVDDSGRRAQHSGLYGFLREHFEQDCREWQANATRSHWDDAPYPRQRILDDLRAGRTVNVPTHSLPRSALSGAPTQPGPTVQYGPRRGSLGVIYPERAIVRPDDTVTFTDDDGAALFIAENGL
jgi:hypothetical protein